MEKRTYFISDLHLGAKYIPSPIDHQRHVVAWLDEIKHKAKALYLMGDVLDYWYEYRYVVPRGFSRFFGKIAELFFGEKYETYVDKETGKYLKA